MNTDQPCPDRSEARRVRVLLVDDSPRVRSDLRLLLDLTGQVEVVGEAGDGREALKLAAELAPEVIVMDLDMPVMDGLEATRQVKEGRLASRVVMLSVHGEPETRLRAHQAGADVFVIKGAQIGTLVEAILGLAGA